MKFVDSISFQNRMPTKLETMPMMFVLVCLDRTVTPSVRRPSPRMLKNLARHCALAFSGPALVPCWVCLGSSQVRCVFLRCLYHWSSCFSCKIHFVPSNIERVCDECGQLMVLQMVISGEQYTELNHGNSEMSNVFYD